MLPIYGDRVLKTGQGEIRLLNFRYGSEGDFNGQIELDLGYYLLSNRCTQYIEFEKTGQEETEDESTIPKPARRRGFRSWIRGLKGKSTGKGNVAKPHDPNIFQYVALSYTWGPDIESEKRDVLINGHIVKVRKNLHAALLQLRLMDKFKSGLKLWIDALTINQDHEEEKRAQILIMHQIYQFAGNVLVWLGPEVEQTFDEEGNPKLQDYEISMQTDAVHRTISVLEEISQYYRSEELEEMDDCGDLRKAHQHREGAAFRLRYALEEWKDLMHENPDFFTTYTGIHEFFDRPYWRRLWIIQELSMGRAGMPIVCGSRVTQWRHIRDAAILLHNVMDIVNDQTLLELEAEETVDTRLHTASHVAGIAQLELVSHRKSLPWVDKTDFEFTSTPGIGGGEPILGSSLAQVLQLAMQADCFEPRDRVFGMINIYGTPGWFKNTLTYSDSPGQIYTAFAKQLLEIGEMEIFTLLDGCLDNLQLPSWVPNFVRPAPRRTTPIRGPWFAGSRNTIQSNLRMLPSIFEVDDGKQILQLHGVTCVDTIDGVGAIQPIIQKIIAPSNSGYAFGIVQPTKSKTKTNPVYIHEHTVKRCLYRTLTCGTDVNGHQKEYRRLLSSFAPEPPSRTHPDFWNWDFFNSSASLIFHGKPLRDWLDQYKGRPDLSYSNDEDRKDWGDVSAAMAAMKSKVRGRRLFVTAERGYLGLGPMNIQPGNILVTVFGCNKPLILELVSPSRFRIKGECYVDDIMEGEAEHLDIPDENIGSIFVE